jgi:hypothetical protein
MLPIEIQMQIDISAASHKQAISEGFAKLRAKLLPELPPDPMRAFMEAMTNSQMSYLQSQLAPYNGPAINLPLQQNSEYWSQASGGNALWGPLFGTYFGQPCISSRA